MPKNRKKNKNKKISKIELEKKIVLNNPDKDNYQDSQKENTEIIKKKVVHIENIEERLESQSELGEQIVDQKPEKILSDVKEDKNNEENNDDEEDNDHEEDSDGEEDGEEEKSSPIVKAIEKKAKKIIKKNRQRIIDYLGQIVITILSQLAKGIRNNKIATLIAVVISLISGAVYNNSVDQQPPQNNSQQVVEEEQNTFPQEVQEPESLIYDYSFQCFEFVVEMMVVILIFVIFIMVTNQSSIDHLNFVFSTEGQTPMLFKYRSFMLLGFLFLELGFVPVMTLFFVPREKKWSSVWKRKFYFENGFNAFVVLLALIVFYLGGIYILRYIFIFFDWIRKSINNTPQ